MAQDESGNPFRETGVGTNRVIQLPVVLPSQSHKSVILVADDEALVRNLVTLLLQQDGHLVLSAANGHEGLELSRRYPGTIELVITDVDMPRLNGADLCAHLLEERPGIKTLVMSGADMGEIVSHNINLPFLPKPFDGVTLKERARHPARAGAAARGIVLAGRHTIIAMAKDEAVNWAGLSCADQEAVRMGASRAIIPAASFTYTGDSEGWQQHEFSNLLQELVCAAARQDDTLMDYFMCELRRAYRERRQ